MRRHADAAVTSARLALVVTALGALSIACAAGAGEGEGEGEDDCTLLCTGAGFDEGTSTDFGGGLVECLCAGDGDGIAEQDCDDYCGIFDVGADKALLSSEASDDDKCVCDGTQA